MFKIYIFYLFYTYNINHNDIKLFNTWESSLNTNLFNIGRIYYIKNLIVNVLKQLEEEITLHKQNAGTLPILSDHHE